MTITPAAFYQPTVVFESGWSEPREQIYSSAELWLKGTEGTYQVGERFLYSDLARGCGSFGDQNITFEIDALRLAATQTMRLDGWKPA
ncbi:uncharacterized protein ASPGLDRAFT_1186094 [Aspergillus glaucus CBS 516.65]|uniref:Uncharacterized protein n=1 Tax=Aspergillus glaucus CBS 516.65 TaxID=1160497 RepID=A0A1L9V4M5_ASPGL|nr:hypothetical protein ASPGLDRAFT_1186094 [Aspergillus glaucus CBS 516.65]OJJ78782.1 hypothetical protein ASPGLDRAFT_1186094 [Aspergillus glaucus CBS 516.65]